ncbi:RHS repeat domain-containing protein [Xenorhabdus miraniensis]|uniref:Insecticidal toxin, SepC/Tcc class n=1 Tax=Xenorhabdus miraniensis TaxID=351674 RepID=A0A2D0JKR6_9GAMM|nr:RHS repeat domain-containing protein [Xenorhabdus miraniensis]PHM46893.1 insecticidal toxin, SepC/Tcc class [Xenorhabdus miraniensis]
MTLNRGNNLHQNTPEVAVLDNRGLTVRELHYHRHPDTPTKTDERITRHRFTLAGQLAHSIDPRLFDLQQTDNTVNPNLIYDTVLTGEVVRTRSVDAGNILTLNDITGRPVLSINATEVTRTWQYENETLPGRPLSITEQPAGEAARITERFIWAGNTQAEKNNNLTGQCVRHYDTAGLNQTDSIALNGVPLSVTRQLLPDGTDADWQGDNESAWNARLAPESFTTLNTADATGVLLTRTDAMGNVQRLAYDVAGLLTGSWLALKNGTEQVIMKSLTYSAAGQKLREEHGNGVVTTYTYEPETQRLVGIKTERPQGHAQGTKVLQDLRYEYDPVGNVLRITNDAETTRFWRNQKVVPENTYIYDSLYQLVSTTGREMANIGQQSALLPIPSLIDNSTYSNYSRTYNYDRGSNLMQIRHSAPTSNNSYTIKMTVSNHSNRAVLNTLTEEPAKVDALFTTGGQQSQLQPGQNLVWTPNGELLKVTPVVRDGQSSDQEAYRYGADSQRIIKTNVQQTANSSQTQRTLYLPGLELRTSINGTMVKEIQHVITVDEASCAQVRVIHWESGKPEGISNNQVRYSYDNLVRSCGLEVDDDGQVISLEEYYPYGGTAVWAARNRTEADYKVMRYSGKERDATGLYYYGYRYYQPWAGRWLSADPAGTVDGINLFRMVRNNPVNYYDEQGDISLPIDVFNSMTISTEGAHGNRKNEVLRLYGKKGVPMVTQSRAGNSNKKPPDPKPILSSEHTILHTISAQGLGRGDNIHATNSLKTAIKKLEKLGHAYQEYDEAHRKHIGSNNGVLYRNTEVGVNPMTEAEYLAKETITNNFATYIDTQRSLLHSNDVSSAIQINQMAYFSDSPELADLVRNNSESQKTHDSFYHSVSVKDSYYYLKNDSEVVSVDVTSTNKIEMILSRLMGVLGRIPSNKELKNVLEQHKVTVPGGMFSLLNDPNFANRSIFKPTETVYISKNAKNKARKQARKNAAKS